MNSVNIVYVCDDDAATRSSLQFLLSQHAIEVKSFANGPDMLSALEQGTKPVRGVFLLDVRMEPITGPQLHDALIERGYGARNPVIFVSGHGDIPIALEAVRKGAKDFIQKPYAAEQLIQLIRAALEEEPQRQNEASEREVLCTQLASLTRQERRLMPLVVAGTANKVSAEELGITEGMVEVHRRNLFKKLGVGSAAELATL